MSGASRPARSWPRLRHATGFRPIRGRWFNGASSKEVVVNESLAAALWPKGEAVGQRLTTGDANRRSHLVVGVGMGGLALLIALGGIAVIASQFVAQRTREIGIRMTLGARHTDAVMLIVRKH
jgi:ABC-type antimicrobial peptide transport system permease subunit